MIKRVFDLLFSFIGLVVMSPLLIVVIILISMRDGHSPFYVARRMGLHGKTFNMIKLRTMVAGADKTGVDSTATDDKRITGVGKFIRRYKLDEFSQLINVFIGDMSLVGPRPNVERDVALYTDEERRLLDVRPGITDLSSIVFSDEGEILEGSADPDLKYNQVIRPWKSRLALLYIEKRSFIVDIYIIFITMIAIMSRRTALVGINYILNRWRTDRYLIDVCRRERELMAYPPPGSDSIVILRNL